jgi:hypothetical protein
MINTIRQCLLILLTVAANLFAVGIVLVFVFSLNSSAAGAMNTASLVILRFLIFFMPVFLFLINLACIIFAIATHSKTAGNAELQLGLRQPIVIYKLFLIPLFLAYNALIIAFLVAGLAAYFIYPAFLAGIATTPIIIVALIILLALIYFLMVGTSSFAISAIFIAYQQKLITKPQLVAFVLLQLILVADVISYPLILKHIKKKELAAAKV